MTKDVDGLDAKLNELQTEISRLQVSHNSNKIQPILKVTTVQPVKNNNNESSLTLITSSPAAGNGESASPSNAFFISFGDSPVKEKPVLSERKVNLNLSQRTIINNKDGFFKESYKQNGFSNEELLVEENSDEMERRKEMIIQRQIKRREQLELIRMKREEERARQADEQRMKDEEFNTKKQIEKTRKDAIFKAYLDKKKQMQDEIGGVIGKPQQQKRLKSSQSIHRLHQATNGHNTSDINEFDYSNTTERSHMSKSKPSIYLFFRVHPFYVLK